MQNYLKLQLTKSGKPDDGHFQTPLGDTIIRTLDGDGDDKILREFGTFSTFVSRVC